MGGVQRSETACSGVNIVLSNKYASMIVGVETDLQLEKTTKIPLFLRHSGVSIFERNPF